MGNLMPMSNKDWMKEEKQIHDRIEKLKKADLIN